MTSSELWLLDGPPNTVRARLIAQLLTLVGVQWKEARFFAGHLRTPSREAVRPAARRLAFRMASDAATELLVHSSLLSRLNQEWGRNTLTLFLARRLWPAAERVALRALVAEALARQRGGGARVMLTWPVELPQLLSTLSGAMSPGVSVGIGALDRGTWRRSQVSHQYRRGTRYARVLALVWLARNAIRRPLAISGVAASPKDLPAILLLQEDDISLDHSYRSQPHWLRPGTGPPPFRTVILCAGGPARIKTTADELAALRIETVEANEMWAGVRQCAEGRRLVRQAWRIALLALFARRGNTGRAMSEVARLTATAAAMAALVKRHGIRAFMTCENYMVHADAMQIVAGPLAVRTLSYQYSSLPYPSLALITTADVVATFSEQYHDRWRWPGFRPPEFVDSGYPYDASFVLVRQRALACRARLQAAGASFVVGVFDESVERERYGLVHADEYEAQLFALLDKVSRDSSLGLVFKTQFLHNLAGISEGLRHALLAAQATGRVELPAVGTHRNVVFPAEVAMASDITVGYVIGGTASLESALAGARSVIVNSYGFVTDMDDLFAQADIMLPTLANALEAIDSHRRGERPLLGDWTSILPSFDHYRDGGAADRLKEVVARATGQ